MRQKSIHWKILLPIIVSLTICMLGYSLYYIHSIKKNAMERFRVSSEVFVQTAAENIDHYFDTCVSAVKSVYSNQSFLYSLTTGAASSATVPGEEQNDVLNYMRSVCAAVPSAVQIYLSLPERGVSFLYLPSEFAFSTSDQVINRNDAIQLDSYMDIYLEETHPKSTYGHTITFSKNSHNQEPVFTIWVPIANIPYSLEIKGYVAVDISISFLVNNCTPDANENEQTYLVTNEGYIMASNIPDKIGQNIQDAVPGLVRNEIGLHTTRGDLTVIADFETDLMSGAFLKITPNSVIYDNTTQNAIGLLVVYAILLILFLLFNIFSISRYTKPLVSLTACMDQIARDKTWQTDTLVSQEVHYVSEDEIGTLICTFDEMLTTLKDAKIRQYELELENIGATLKMLQAQINPHFIYNMLQYFATSALKNNDMALYSELSSFGQMLHYSMMIDPPVATVNQEIDYIRRYISLQQARFNTTEPADIQVDIEAGLISIPKMSIVPLVENSFKHGKIYRCPGGILQLLVTKKEHNLVIEVTDNGVPIDPQKAEQLCDVLRQFRQRISDHSFSAERPIAEQNVKMGLVDSTSVGLQNVYTRLFLHFGNCSIHMHANQLGGTTVLMSVPLSEKDAEN